MAETNIQDLTWDSEFFSLKVGEITVEDNDVDLTTDVDQYDLLYIKGETNFTVTVAGFEESFSEIKVVFAKKLTANADKKSKFIFTDREIPFKIEKVYELAFESGKNSRFKLDANFEATNFESLYKIWVDNSINRKFADGVLLYVKDSEIFGFVTYKIHGDFATIGLIAVSPDAQGKGIGSQLIFETEQELIKSGITELKIPTQLTNQGACSFYKKHGYKISETTYIKHFWKSKSI